MRPLTFAADEEVLNLGVKILTARVSNIKNTKSSPTLDSFIEEELVKIKTYWQDKDYKQDPILQGFKELHTSVGRSNRDYPASPEVLLRLLIERDRFPRINCVVDIYNLFSVKTHLALGAHDIEKVNGNITLRLTRGDETFVPLGRQEKVQVPAGEYAYIDDGNNIICRMEVLQIEPTKITEDSKDIFLIIQGNKNTDTQYIKETTDDLLTTLTKSCGGNHTLLNSVEE